MLLRNEYETFLSSFLACHLKGVWSVFVVCELWHAIQEYLFFRARSKTTWDTVMKLLGREMILLSVLQVVEQQEASTISLQEGHSDSILASWDLPSAIYAVERFLHEPSGL